jgi:hypothetical protein
VGKTVFTHLGHLSSLQRNVKHNGQLKKVIINYGHFFFRNTKYFYFFIRAAFANNGLRLKKVGDFEVQTLF